MKTNKLSILDTIKKAVEELKWNSETKKEKALNLCISIFNLYIYEGGDFIIYKQLSKSYFKKIIKTSSYIYEIKNNLIDNGIIEVYKNGSYTMNKNCKGYRFNTKLLYGNYTDLNGPKSLIKEFNTDLNGPKNLGQDLKLSNKVNNNLRQLSNIINNKSNSLHISGPKLETYINSGLEDINFKKEVNTYINNFSIKKEDIITNEDIIDEYVKVVFDLDSYKYKKENALKLSHDQGLDLIKYKDKCYIDNIELFLIRKTNDIRLILRKSIFEIENKIFRVSRNETNRRLDYNLTNMKSDLFDYILFEGEELIELDIANAQFSILSFLTNDLDEDFIKLSIEGKLYNFISEKLNITIKQAKEKMFRVAFDRVEKYQDDIREIFPLTMEFIDNYKNEFGYKSFSNLCQNTESLIMIDGLLTNLINKGYKVFTIHDAIRVKKSDLENVRKDINIFFEEINLKCLLREKTKKEKEIINFKGFKQVEIDKVTQEDKKLFISKINVLKDIDLEPSEGLLLDMNIFSYEKTCYLYDKWRKSNPYKEYKIKE